MPTRRLVVEDDESSDDDERDSPRDACVAKPTASKKRRIVNDDDSDDDGDSVTDGSGGVQGPESETSEEDADDDDDSGAGDASSDDDGSDGGGSDDDDDDGADHDNLGGFIVPDEDEGSDDDAASGSESEEEDEASDSDEGAIVEVEEDPAPIVVPSRTREQILEAVGKVRGWDVSNDVVYREDLGKHANDGRKRGSYPAILVPELCRVLGRSAMNTELMEDGMPVFFEGLDVKCCYKLDEAEQSVIGCLCTQTPDRGGLKKIFEVKHRPSGVSFLMGQCCAHYSSGRDMREMYYEYSDAGGLRGRMCLPCDRDLVF